MFFIFPSNDASMALINYFLINDISIFKSKKEKATLKNPVLHFCIFFSHNMSIACLFFTAPMYGDCFFDGDNWIDECNWKYKELDFNWTRAKKGRSDDTGPIDSQNPKLSSKKNFLLFAET